jgi:hypothetical protein
MLTGTHICAECRQELPVSEFAWISQPRLHPAWECKACIAERRGLRADTLDGRLSTILGAARGRSRGACDLTRDSLRRLWDEQSGRCALSGVELSTARNRWDTASLDRIDGDEGYRLGNLRIVADAVNRMRGNMEDATFAYWCLRVAEAHFRFKLKRREDETQRA